MIVGFREEFKVAQHKVGVLQHLLGLCEIADARGVERGMHAVFMELFEEFRDKFSLKKCGSPPVTVTPPPFFQYGRKRSALAHQLVRIGRRARPRSATYPDYGSRRSAGDSPA